MTVDYGAKGCRCFMADDYSDWMPNASCPHHGLLAGLARDRMETGTYRVVTGPCERHPGASTIAGLCAMCSRPESAVLPELAHKDAEAEVWGEVLYDDSDRDVYGRPDLSTSLDGPERPPGVHSIFDPCPGGWADDDTPAARCDEHDRAIPCRPCMRERDLSTPPDGPECPPGVHSGVVVDTEADRIVRNLQVGGLTEEAAIELRERFAAERRPCPTRCQANPMDCPGPAADGSCLGLDSSSEPRLLGTGYRTTTEKESGVLATVRRWWWKRTNFWPFVRRS